MPAVHEVTKGFGTSSESNSSPDRRFTVNKIICDTLGAAFLHPLQLCKSHCNYNESAKVQTLSTICQCCEHDIVVLGYWQTSLALEVNEHAAELGKVNECTTP